MTDFISEKIQQEINKLKFFAKLHQKKLNISRSESLDRVAYFCFGIPSWSFVKNKYLSESYPHKTKVLHRIGACNFSFDSKHIKNIEYAFRYWLDTGRPSAIEIAENVSENHLEIFKSIFYKLASPFQGESVSKIIDDLTISNSERKDFFDFLGHADNFQMAAHERFFREEPIFEPEEDEFFEPEEDEFFEPEEDEFFDPKEDENTFDADVAWAYELNDRLDRIAEVITMRFIDDSDTTLESWIVAAKQS